MADLNDKIKKLQKDAENIFYQLKDQYSSDPGEGESKVNLAEAITTYAQKLAIESHGNNYEPESMHEAKDIWTDITCTASYCDKLSNQEYFNKLIEGTVKFIPERKKYKFGERFQLIPDGKLKEMREKQASSDRNGERILEALIFNQWFELSAEHLWDRLVAWQIPLFAKKKKAGWGFIDLLGYINGRPCVIELKKANNYSDTPLRALLEALSYAIVVRYRWKTISDELGGLKSALTWAESVTLKEIPIVLLAPEKYWQFWKKEEGEFYKTGCRAFDGLVNKLRSEDYKISLASVKVDSEMKDMKIGNIKNIEHLLPN
jgi:hypothetical protein